VYERTKVGSGIRRPGLFLCRAIPIVLLGSVPLATLRIDARAIQPFLQTPPNIRASPHDASRETDPVSADAGRSVHQVADVSQFLLALGFVAALATPASPGQPADLAARSRAASAAMEVRRFDEAARIYRELIQALPNDAGLHMNLGMALAMGGREPDAIGPLERAIKLNPGLIPAHLFLGSSLLALGQPAKAIAPLERVVAAQPGEVEPRRLLAQAYLDSRRPRDAVQQWRKVSELAPDLPASWYGLGHAYNAITQDALGTFDDQPQTSPWRELLVADALFSDGRLTDAFALYRSTLQRLPAMVTIHDAIARIYEQTGHKAWAATERAKGTLSDAACVKRKALCDFRAGRYQAALETSLGGSDPESRYWRARAATELALGAFKRLDKLPDSRERRETRATHARAERRYPDAIAELKAALKFAAGDPALLDDLGTAYFLARDYEQALATLAPVLKLSPDDPRLLTMYGESLVQLQRLDEAVPVLQRAIKSDPSNPQPRLILGRAHLQKGNFAAAIPLIEPQLAQDEDGSLHTQLARAYTGAGQKEKAEKLLQRAQTLQEAAQKRNAATAQRTITPPK
jgi:tetratricopeptide (TPR) repeat protein